MAKDLTEAAIGVLADYGYRRVIDRIGLVSQHRGWQVYNGDWPAGDVVEGDIPTVVAKLALGDNLPGSRDMARVCHDHGHIPVGLKGIHLLLSADWLDAADGVFQVGDVVIDRTAVLAKWKGVLREYHLA